MAGNPGMAAPSNVHIIADMDQTEQAQWAIRHNISQCRQHLAADSIRCCIAVLHNKSQKSQAPREQATPSQTPWQQAVSMTALGAALSETAQHMKWAKTGTCLT